MIFHMFSYCFYRFSYDFPRISYGSFDPPSPSVSLSLSLFLSGHLWGKIMTWCLKSSGASFSTTIYWFCAFCCELLVNHNNHELIMGLNWLINALELLLVLFSAN